METTSQIVVSELVEQVGSLPQVAAKVVTMAADPECDIGEMSKVISCDNAMTLRFMAIANSASISMGNEVKNLRSALIRLGLLKVRNLALLMGIHDMEPSRESNCFIDHGEFWRYCLATASCAQGLAWLRSQPNAEENAWLAGILHGIGITALQQKACSDFRRAVTLAQSEGIPLAEAELQFFDFHHGELGAGILQAWHMPKVIIETVRVFPDPAFEGDLLPETAPLVSVLRDAVTAARAIGFAQNGDGGPIPDIQELSTRLNLTDQTLDALAERVDDQVFELSGLIGLGIKGDTFAGALEASRSAVAHLGLEGIDDHQRRQRLENQLTSARDIQLRLLPEQCPTWDGFELAGFNRPSLHVSGDTYDFVTLRDGRPAFVIADVCGKGIPAALLASTVQASIRALAQVFADPGELLAAANSAMYQATDSGRFTTLFMAAVSEDGSGIQYASAGHNPPLLLRADGSVEWLEPNGTPLGIVPEMEYPVREIRLGEGDLLVAYTDGITEATNDDDVEFEETGLEQVVKIMAHAPLNRITDFIISAVHAHVEGTELCASTEEILNQHKTSETKIDVGDDLTLVLLRKSS